MQVANQRGPCEYGRVGPGAMRGKTYKKVRIDGEQAETG